MMRLTGSIAVGVACLLPAGCDDFANMGERKPANPPGIASPEDVSSVGESAPAAQTPSESPAPAQPAEPAQPERTEPPKQSGSIIGQRTGVILDLKVARARNPNLVISDNKVSGNDPLSQAGSIYGRAAAVGGSAGLVQWIQHQKVLNDRFPTHAEVVEFIKMNNAQLPVLPGGQMWGYDSDSGAIVTVQQR